MTEEDRNKRRAYIGNWYANLSDDAKNKKKRICKKQASYLFSYKMKIKKKINGPKIRKGNNPSFSKNASNNIGQYFLLLIQKYFPNNLRYKIFNKIA